MTIPLFIIHKKKYPRLSAEELEDASIIGTIFAFIGIAQISLETGVPVLFGIVTTENIEQAIARAGSKAGNKGYDCALSTIEMVNLISLL